MNWDQIEGNWKQFKGKVKEKWGKLTDDELEELEGNRDQLVGKIQEQYGISRTKPRSSFATGPASKGFANTWRTPVSDGGRYGARHFSWSMPLSRSCFFIERRNALLIFAFAAQSSRGGRSMRASGRVFYACPRVPPEAANTYRPFWSGRKANSRLHEAKRSSKRSTDEAGAVNCSRTHLATEEQITDLPLVIGNRVTLLQDGPATYKAMYIAIRAAKDHINLETYICRGRRDRPVSSRIC